MEYFFLQKTFTFQRRPKALVWSKGLSKKCQELTISKHDVVTMFEYITD